VSILPRITSRPRPHALVALALASSLALSALVSVDAASAAKVPSTPTASAPHCLTKVIGRSASGELQLSTPACYATMADVNARAGGGGGAMAFGGTFILAVHYDGANLTGSSISVEGSDCYGGYINLTGWWANRVSSTANTCPEVNHYYWPDLVGSHQTTYGTGGNLTSLNNLSESISYTGW